MAWQFYEWAKDQPVKPVGRKLILMLVADHADADARYSFPSLSYLSVESGLSERQIQNHLKALAEEDGLLRIEKVKSKRGQYEFSRYWLLGTKDSFAPYFAEDKPYLKARAALAEERNEAIHERPPSGSVLPLGAMVPGGSTASSPAEAWRPGQRKPTSAKPKEETEYENTRDGAKQSFERSGSESLAPRRAVASAPASDTESSSNTPKIYPRGRPVKNPTPNQKDLQRAGDLIDRLGNAAAASAINEFAKRCGRVVGWAQERVAEHAHITEAPEDSASAEYWAYWRHVYFWCMKKYVSGGDWPPELLEPLRTVAHAA